MKTVRHVLIESAAPAWRQGGVSKHVAEKEIELKEIQRPFRPSRPEQKP